MAEAAAPNEPTEPAEPVDAILDEAVAELGADMLGVPAQEESEPAEPAENEEAAPAEPADTAAPQTQDAAPAAAPATTPAIDDQRFRPSKTLAERIAKNRADAVALQTKIKDGSFSAIDDNGELARLQLESMELRDALDDERENHSATISYWDNFARANPTVGAKKGQQLYADAFKAVRERYPNWSEAQIAGGAAIAWENMLEKLRVAPPAPAKPNPGAPAKPVIATGKAPVKTGFAPTGRTGAPKPKAPKDPADEFGEFAAKNGLDLSDLTG